MKRKTCTFHCRTCDQHFHGLEAFDMHRVFADPKVEDWDTRICIPADDPRLTRDDGNPELVPYTTDGYCKIVSPKPQTGITIWQKFRPDRHEDQTTPGAVGAGRPAEMFSEGGNIQDPLEVS